MFNRCKLLQTSTLALVTPVWAQCSESPFSNLKCRQILPDVKLLSQVVWRLQNDPAGMLTLEVAKMQPKPKGLSGVVVLKIDKANPGVGPRQGAVVFAESGEMFPEDIEGLKKYI